MFPAVLILNLKCHNITFLLLLVVWLTLVSKLDIQTTEQDAAYCEIVLKPPTTKYFLNVGNKVPKPNHKNTVLH